MIVVIACTQQLVESTSVNGEMASLYTALLLIVLSHTYSEHSLTHSIELMCTAIVC